MKEQSGKCRCVYIPASHTCHQDHNLEQNAVEPESKLYLEFLTFQPSLKGWHHVESHSTGASTPTAAHKKKAALKTEYRQVITSQALMWYSNPYGKYARTWSPSYKRHDVIIRGYISVNTHIYPYRNRMWKVLTCFPVHNCWGLKMAGGTSLIRPSLSVRPL